MIKSLKLKYNHIYKCHSSGNLLNKNSLIIIITFSFIFYRIIILPIYIYILYINYYYIN